MSTDGSPGYRINDRVMVATPETEDYGQTGTVADIDPQDARFVYVEWDDDLGRCDRIAVSMIEPV